MVNLSKSNKDDTINADKSYSDYSDISFDELQDFDSLVGNVNKVLHEIKSITSLNSNNIYNIFLLEALIDERINDGVQNDDIRNSLNDCKTRLELITKNITKDDILKALEDKPMLFNSKNNRVDVDKENHYNDANSKHMVLIGSIEAKLKRKEKLLYKSIPVALIALAVRIALSGIHLKAGTVIGDTIGLLSILSVVVIIGSILVSCVAFFDKRYSTEVHMKSVNETDRLQYVCAIHRNIVFIKHKILKLSKMGNGDASEILNELHRIHNNYKDSVNDYSEFVNCTIFNIVKPVKYIKTTVAVNMMYIKYRTLLNKLFNEAIQEEIIKAAGEEAGEIHGYEQIQ